MSHKGLVDEVIDAHNNLNPDEDEDWMDNGKCRNKSLDPDIWFSEKGDADSDKYAISICNLCPVVYKCLEYAIRNDMQYGIWGGLKPEARRKLIKLAGLEYLKESGKPSRFMRDKEVKGELKEQKPFIKIGRD